MKFIGKIGSHCLLTTLLLHGVLGCQQAGNDGRSNVGGGSSSGEGGNTPGGNIPEGSGTAAKLNFENLKVTSLFTEETAENTCASFTVKSSDSLGGDVADVKVVLTLQTTGMTDSGKLTPEAGLTDANGELTASYCSGESEGTVTVVATAGTVMSNSSKISVSKKPIFAFTYLRSDTDPALLPGDGEKDSTVVYLNLLDSGPQDCTNLYFKLTKSGSPVVGTAIKFSSQPDFPKGAKLAKRDTAVTTETLAQSQKKVAIYNGISSGAGEFAVPICAGVSLGTILVSGTYTDAEGRNFVAKSPVIRITAGLTNFINMSLSFDPINGRVLKGYYNTNTDFELSLQIQLGARQDGQPISEYPAFVATEVGKVIIADGGTPDKEKGTVDVKIRALHLVDNYPYTVLKMPNHPLAQTRCEPQELAAWATATGQTQVLYKDLGMNWRTTMTYGIRGQEYYHDANRNGVYDAGGDGFWDKNQNGIYDTGDQITYDAGNDGLVNRDGEWFIDLPTPFVDVDENSAYDATKDILIGDEYVAANGKRDSDTIVWKKEVLPVSMGPSNYGLLRYRVQASNYALADATLTYAGATYPVFGSQVINTNVLFGGPSVTASSARYESLIFLHDLCGNLLPGGTEIQVDYSEISHDPAWGDRKPLAVIYSQPGDNLLEPSRRLVNNLDDSSKAVVNFNVVDHPAANFSYPLITSFDIPACTAPCTGYVNTANPGVSCDGFTANARITLNEPKMDRYNSAARVLIRTPISYPSYSTCNCVSGAFATAGICGCPDGKSYNAASNACI